MTEQDRISLRSECARRVELARGFAGLARDRAAREHFIAIGRQWHLASLEADGPLSPEVAAMTDAQLLRDLEG
jgi:hypothetical protein